MKEATAACRVMAKSYRLYIAIAESLHTLGFKTRGRHSIAVDNDDDNDDNDDDDDDDDDVADDDDDDDDDDLPSVLSISDDRSR